jgi:hypothetical protein
MKSLFTAETVGALRRMLHIPTPMNVWKRQFTQLSWADEMEIERQRDIEFMTGTSWPQIVTVKTPARFIGVPKKAQIVS